MLWINFFAEGGSLLETTPQRDSSMPVKLPAVGPPPTLAMPAVVMTGDRDLIVAPKRHALAFAQAVPAAKLIVLPGIGHMLHHAAAEQVVAEIERLGNSA